jgi:hypothetical protein
MKDAVNVIVRLALLGWSVWFAEQALRAASWAIDSIGLLVATSLLALKYFRKGNDCVAAGFLVFAIGQGVMLSEPAATLEASLPSFAAGIALRDIRCAFVHASRQ